MGLIFTPFSFEIRVYNTFKYYCNKHNWITTRINYFINRYVSWISYGYFDLIHGVCFYFKCCVSEAGFVSVFEIRK